MASQFQIGDRVYIKTASNAPGDTLYTVEEFLPRCGCMIREVSTEPETVYSPQRWDTGLLFHEREAKVMRGD